MSNKVLSLICLCLTLAGCSTPQQSSDSSPTAECRTLEAEQGGVIVRPVAGTIALARQPFVLRLNDAGSSPGIHVALDSSLLQALRAANSRELWLSAGDVMAGGPGLLLVKGQFRLFASDSRQSAFVSAFGHRNAMLLGAGGSLAASPMLAGEIPRNTWLERQGNSQFYVYPVRTIDGTPVERTAMPVLHLVSFSALQGYPSSQMALFHRSNWSACVIRFRQ